MLQTVPCDVLVTDLAMPGGQYGDGLPLIGYLRRMALNMPGMMTLATGMEQTLSEDLEQLPASLRPRGGSGQRDELPGG